MTTTVNLSLTDYMKIAALVNDGTTDSPSRFEVEYTVDGYSLFLDVTHDFDTREVPGGSNSRRWRKRGQYRLRRLTTASISTLPDGTPTANFERCYATSD